MWSTTKCFYGGLVTGLTLMILTKFPPPHPKDAEEDIRATIWQQGFAVGLFTSLAILTALILTSHFLYAMW